MLKKMTFLAMFFLLLFYGLCFTSPAAEIDTESFELNGRVMAVDPVKRVIYVSEKEINLMFHYENGVRVWDTHFSNQEGGPITLDQIKKKDIVLVQGKVVSEKITATKITLLKSKK